MSYMPNLKDALTLKSTGSDFFDLLDRTSSEYSRNRQKQLKSLAAVKATAEIEGLLYPNFDRKLNGYDLHFAKERITAEWLTALLVSVQPDIDKESTARDNIKNILQGKMNSKDLNDVSTEFLRALSDDFRKMRSLKQSIYYRTRSVNAVLKFATSSATKLSKLKCTNEIEAKNIINALGREYLDFHEGAKFTRNSYFGEFQSYLQDIWPTLVTQDSHSLEKSLDEKLSQSIANLAPLLEKNTQLQNKYELFKNLLRDSEAELTKTAKSKLKATLEYKVLKGEGLVAVYTPENQGIGMLKDLETRFLLASSNFSEAAQISVQVVTKPKSQLLVKCTGELTESVVVNFRSFIEAILN
jgi:hypothetical protein